MNDYRKGLARDAGHHPVDTASFRPVRPLATAPLHLAASPTRQAALDQARESAHPQCVACGSTHGARLHFVALEDGTVETAFAGGELYQGYPGFLHGGVIATLLDAAMTNCLFSQGRVAMTAELAVRYHRPVAADRGCTVRARLERAWGPLYVLQAELIQDGEMRVSATGKFMEKSSPS